MCHHQDKHLNNVFAVFHLTELILGTVCVSNKSWKEHWWVPQLSSVSPVHCSKWVEWVFLSPCGETIVCIFLALGATGGEEGEGSRWLEGFQFNLERILVTYRPLKELLFIVQKKVCCWNLNNEICFAQELATILFMGAKLSQFVIMY